MAGEATAARLTVKRRLRQAVVPRPLPHRRRRHRHGSAAWVSRVPQELVEMLDKLVAKLANNRRGTRSASCRVRARSDHSSCEELRPWKSVEVMGGRYGGKTVPVSSSAVRRARSVLAMIKVPETVPPEDRESAVRIIAEILTMTAPRRATPKRRPPTR